MEWYLTRMYAWNSISKAGFRAAMPRSIARDLREQARREGEIKTCPDDVDENNEKPIRKTSTTSPPPALASSESKEIPKGCYCQLGSVFRAIFFLFFILAVTAGVCYWIYQGSIL